MTTAIVVHYTGATRQSRSVVASLVVDLVDEGHRVIVADIGAFTTINQDFPPPWLARLLGHRIFPNALEEVVSHAGAEYRHLTPRPGSSGAFPADIVAECETAIESELLTYFRRESLEPSTPYMRWLRQRLSHQARATYEILLELFRNEKPDLVLVPNGRTSRQKVARKAAESSSARVNFYEMGRARSNSYYRGTTQPHDRLASQAEVQELTKHLSPGEITALAEGWLSERMSPESGTNQFSSLWKTGAGGPDLETQGSGKTAVFFSSSADEFLAFGPMWNIDTWGSQFEAFDLIMTHFESLGVNLILRLHPNLTTKSRRYFQNAVGEIRALKRNHPSLTIHWHNSSVSSYDLITSADYVIAERSTIALEANLLGTPVWINQAAQWDLIADVRQVLSPAELTPEVLTPWEVDPRPAQGFVAYWMIQEHPLRFTWRDWATWNPDDASLPLKLAVLLVKNPWRHRWHLLHLEWARIRNSFFRS
ncbi:MAG TPA: hypothetical protein VGP34_02145 [Pontimonas sp.]|nr:hypothetical protein [Pontimonas sp.]